MSGDAEFGMTEALGKLSVGQSLSRAEAELVMGSLLSGKATPAQIGAFLMGLRIKGETSEEISGLVAAMRAASIPVKPRREGLLDLCGTGGDGSGSFNISTAAALVAAGCGAPVAKHGNRSASSLCGSADVLEALGVPIDLGPEEAARSIDELGFAFLFARTYHPAMRFVAAPRSELKMRTVFNVLGPLTNPAGARRQLLGVFDDALRSKMATALRNLGSDSVWVVHGEGGLDELSISGTSRVTVANSEGVSEIEVQPEDAGLSRHPPEALAGGDARTNAKIILGIAGAEKGACRDAVVLNAAASLVVHGTATDLKDGAARVAEAIDSGRVLDLIEKLRAFS